MDPCACESVAAAGASPRHQPRLTRPTPSTAQSQHGPSPNTASSGAVQWGVPQVIENLIDQSDRVMCIGGMAYTFMKVSPPGAHRRGGESSLDAGGVRSAREGRPVAAAPWFDAWVGMCTRAL